MLSLSYAQRGVLWGLCGGEAHHRGLHDRDSLGRLALVRDQLSRAYRERTPRFHDFSTRQKALAFARQQQVDFELDTQNAMSGGHHRISCVSTGAIDQSGDDACVQKAVLLGEMLLVRSFDLHKTLFDMAEAGSKGVHDLL